MVTEETTNVINLTKDGQVTKRILKEGVGLSPEKNDTVTVHYDAYLFDKNILFDSSRERRAEFTFSLNSGKVIQAWEIAIPTMKVGEIAEVICSSDYGYGDEGRTYIVPKKAKLRYEIELIGHWESATTAEDRIASAEKKKAEGNELFKKGAWNEALFAYKKGRDYIKDLWNCEYEQLEQCRYLMVALHLNVAACYLKLKNFEYAIEVCKKALDRDSSNLKAYYRIGQAYLQLGEFDEGLSFVNTGLEMSPINSDLLSLKSTIEKKKKDWINDSKRIYKKMCN
ncbi:uncharacterized protein BX663DRAFT_558468 [Cokeromyces recurvatus]|uniref:uncharacterized protein n=1 Tax=Cokeromyces recurvatus TaxID=90255 RepID=UPI00221E3C31|nr:uncharacterized protein BX663DRAFT_558468 [Cokeromyces recurvatus]KAI7905871.1 hypothetical protein BX663DRAFT_558468 [Cokeromyces recurvatus]